MIVLLTGVPGSGKTSKIVAELEKVKDRPVFSMGIPELKLPHQAVPPVNEWTRLEPSPEDAAVLRPVFNFPPNSIIVIDEAQNVYRPRPSGSKVPDIVAAFETHRHTGVDFWLITQHPSLLDSNIRRLIAKHWHVHVSPLGRTLLEWAQCRDPDSKSDRSDAIKTAYKPDKRVFNLYKSAEAHTKLKRSIPKTLILMAVCAVLAVGLGIYAFQRISAKVTKPQSAETSQLAKGHVGAGAVSVPAQQATAPPARVPSDFINSFTPVHPNFPESAPAYDAVRVVKSMPIVAGCIKTADWCRCYSQQGTKLDIQAERCADYISNKVFDPYREPVHLAQAAAASEKKDAGPFQPVPEAKSAPKAQQ